MAKKIWKNKKGGIPAINEIVMTILNITPKPILFLIFILLLTTIVTFVMPVFLNFFGYECLIENNELVLYQVPMNKIVQKSLADVRRDLRGVVGFEDYQLPDDPFPDNDRRYLRIPPDCFVEVNINGTTVEGYSSTCVNCTQSGLFRYYGSICLDDGYYDPNLITKYWIGSANFCYKCAPPSPYYYNHTNCLSMGNCFFTITDESLLTQVTDSYSYDYYLQNIKRLGGVIRPQDSTEIVNIQCADFNKPQLYFFNIELFNRTMWIILGVGWALITLAYGYYSLVLPK